MNDHMIGTSHRGPVQQSVFCCVRRTQRTPDCGAACSQGVCTSREGGRTFINGHPPLHCSCPAVCIHGQHSG
ncbi:unnamed protein product [Staurois parvus]|uniref:Uncharacterized protein n=1 Tax=Staurois parvus TaxID=386267 RepID=A0ABN9BSE3_9NEOB|nr:unnamed protein product [Staurois parvus]